MEQNSIRRLLAAWRRDKLGSFSILAASAVFGAVLMGLQTFYLWQEYDPAYHVYQHGSSAMTVLTILLFAAAGVLLLLLLLPKTQFAAQITEGHASVRAMNAACALGCLYAAVRCVSFRAQLFSGGVATVLLQLLLVLCAVYFLLRAQTRFQCPVLQGALGFAVILMPILRVFSLYFDHSRPMMAPLKLFELAGALALAVYFLTEQRQQLGIPMPRLHQSLRGIAIVALGLSAVPQVILFLATQQSYGVDTVFAVLETVLFCRLVLEGVCSIWPKEWDELLNYLLFGVLTTVVNLLAFFALTRLGGMEVLLANVFAWIVGVLFAYAVNKFLVFEAKERTWQRILIELGLFVAARLLSFGAEELILFVGVYLLSGSDIVAKVIAAVVVIVLNYIASKFVIFRKKKEA